MKRGRKNRKPQFSQREEAILRAHFEAFREKFGRDPTGDDPVFFDPFADTPVPLNADRMRDGVILAMLMNEVEPQIIYGFAKTGLLPTKDTPLTKEDRAEWLAAIDEYFRLEEEQAKRDKN
jgi:hypothetical protein